MAYTSGVEMKPVPVRSRTPPVVSVPAVTVPSEGVEPERRISPPTEIVPAPSMEALESFLRSVTPPWMIRVSSAVIRRIVSCGVPCPPSMVSELRVAVGTSKVTM